MPRQTKWNLILNIYNKLFLFNLTENGKTKKNKNLSFDSAGLIIHVWSVVSDQSKKL